ncbi:unnamed protein product [Nippostrongylus brasiliensis]|uniref:Uncharacterized protein n=1 Tax=Nippostrongylus brasiliensis TaxID=27835 RepID=A0A0N4XTN4_NIPBR|nr:unnamed protein product [Nippostrongylus brasiliensis]
MWTSSAYMTRNDKWTESDEFYRRLRRCECGVRWTTTTTMEKRRRRGESRTRTASAPRAYDRELSQSDESAEGYTTVLCLIATRITTSCCQQACPEASVRN